MTPTRHLNRLKHLKRLKTYSSSPASLRWHVVKPRAFFFSLCFFCGCSSATLIRAYACEAEAHQFLILALSSYSAASGSAASSTLFPRPLGDLFGDFGGGLSNLLYWRAAFLPTVC